MSAKISWGRSVDGHVSSKCGRWSVAPVYFGRENPVAFDLRDGRQFISQFSCQRDAKKYAEHWKLKTAGGLPPQADISHLI